MEVVNYSNEIKIQAAAEALIDQKILAVLIESDDYYDGVNVLSLKLENGKIIQLRANHNPLDSKTSLEAFLEAADA